MMNFHFFDEDDKSQKLTRFFQMPSSTPKKIAIFLDPPFSAFIPILSFFVKKLFLHISQIGNSSETKINLFLFFPYYEEEKIKKKFFLEEFYMSDYQVNYQNHKKFKSNKADQASPIRIFTNLKLSMLNLPKPDYWFCKTCQKFTFLNNVHCLLCDRYFV